MKTWLAAVLCAAAIGTPALAAETPPDLRRCPRAASPDSGERERAKPLPVPAALRGIVRSDLYHYAVSTLTGATICDDVSWVNQIDEVRLTPDRRFLTYSWLGYESYGHKLIDRAGRGKVLEVGAAPVFSPARGLFASVDQTESEFGAQSGLVIWRIAPGAVAEVARLEDIPRMYGWRIDGWGGEACLKLSAIPHTLIRGGDQDTSKLRRSAFVAKPAGRAWRLAPASGANRCPS